MLTYAGIFEREVLTGAREFFSEHDWSRANKNAPRFMGAWRNVKTPLRITEQPVRRVSNDTIKQERLIAGSNPAALTFFNDSQPITKGQYMNDRPKLSDLDPKDQADIVQRRLEETRLLQQSAYRCMDPIALAALELDAQARLMGVHMEYQEELEEGEEC